MKKSTYAFSLGILIGCIIAAVAYYLYQKPKYKKQIGKALSWLDSRLPTPTKPTKKVKKPVRKFNPKKFTRKLA